MAHSGTPWFGQIGRVDVLMIPIDSQFHILKADEIAAIRSRLSPRVLIPMHYRHDDLELVLGKPEALGGIDGWAKGEATCDTWLRTAGLFSRHASEVRGARLPDIPTW